MSLEHTAETLQDEEDFPGFGGVARLLESASRPFQQLFCGNHPEPVVWDDSEEYDFSHASRGVMLIFNNEYFKTHSSDRPGSSIDAENLKETFAKLGFAVRCYNNQTRDEMMHVLKKASKEDHSNADCFGCSILSHGDHVYVVDSRRPGFREKEDLVYATDQVILTREVTKLFTDSKCPTLKGKPRLFFIQACRGDQLDIGVNVATSGRDDVDARPVNDLELVPSPIFKDFLIMYATPPGYYAFRRPDIGSWFARALCTVLSQSDVENQNLLNLLTKVIKMVAQEYESRSVQMKISGKKQTPCFSSMLVKDVLFRKVSVNSPDGTDSNK